MTPLTIVVVRYQTPGWGYAESISKHTRDYDLVSVENTDRKDSLVGIWNDWLKRAPTRYVCLLNPDVMVGPRWAEICLEGFLDPNVVMVGPTMGGSTFENQFRYLEGKPGMPLEERVEATSALASRERGVFQEGPVNGACMFLDTTRILKLGGFDPKLAFWGNDKDMYLTVKKAGLRAVIARGAFIFHEGSASIKKARQDPRRAEWLKAEWESRLAYFESKWGVRDIGVKMAGEKP